VLFYLLVSRENAHNVSVLQHIIVRYNIFHILISCKDFGEGGNVIETDRQTERERERASTFAYLDAHNTEIHFIR
jgi:hypothetical protein